MALWRCEMIIKCTFQFFSSFKPMWCKYNDIANESSFQFYPERPSKHPRHFQLSSFRNCLTQLGAKHPSRFMDVYQDWDAFGTFIFCFLIFSVNNMPEAPQNISVIVTEVSSWDCFFPWETKRIDFFFVAFHWWNSGGTDCYCHSYVVASLEPLEKFSRQVLKALS